jgi:hypothetical protein
VDLGLLKQKLRINFTAKLTEKSEIYDIVELIRDK